MDSRHDIGLPMQIALGWTIYVVTMVFGFSAPILFSIFVIERPDFSSHVIDLMHATTLLWVLVNACRWSLARAEQCQGLRTVIGSRNSPLMKCGHRPNLKRRTTASLQLVAPLTFLLCSMALAQSGADVQRPGDSEWFRHIRTTDPGGRPNGPLRQDNISDEEVREVQQAALEVYPDSIVNISGVTDGCNCEEGSACTAQVWLALYREEHIRGLVLSKIGGHWKVGAV